MKLNLLFLLWIIPLSTHAQITTDGTLGQTLKLLGPDYQINADLGQQRGGNLFHSFQDFNLQSFESATFSGPNHIQNVISRVMGGNPSRIDGLFRSTIPNADVYFLNPYGIMFVPNARLDVQGSFHASTADYLRFQDEARFSARNPGDSLLTVAPIESFGFLTDSPAAIAITDSHLEVQPTQTLSLTGGDISFINTEPATYDEASHHIFTNQLVAPSGLIIVDAEGTINLNNFGIDTSGLFGGQISIRGKHLEMNDSRISSYTFGALDGQSIDIRVNNLFMQDSDIVAYTFGKGLGSQINLDITENIIATKVNRPLGIASNAVMEGSSHIGTATMGLANSGDIDVQSHNVTLDQGANIYTRSTSTGNAGNIKLDITGKLQASDVLKFTRKQARFRPDAAGIRSLSFASGNSGNLDITAQHFLLEQGGQLTATTLGAGKGGNVSVQANHIDIKAQDLFTSLPSMISSSSTRGSTGATGTVEVEANHINIEEGGVITTTTLSAGDANMVKVTVSDTLKLSGVGEVVLSISGENTPYFSNISSSSLNVAAIGGNAGQVYVQTKQLILESGATISSFTYGGGNAGNTNVLADIIHITGSKLAGLRLAGLQNSVKLNGFLSPSGIKNGSYNVADYAGLAGDIHVIANQIIIQNGGVIDTSAANVSGGNIRLQVQDSLYLFKQGRVTTSVSGGIGSGGNISIDNQNFIVMNESQIIAQADAGQGGNIRIVAEQFIKSYQSLVSASSRLGLDGDVEINAPDENVTEGMLTLSSETVDAGRMMEKPCEAMTYQEHKNRAHFVVQPLAGSPASPYDLQPSPLSKTTKQPQQTSQKTMTHQPHSGSRRHVNFHPFNQKCQ